MKIKKSVSLKKLHHSLEKKVDNTFLHALKVTILEKKLQNFISKMQNYIEPNEKKKLKYKETSKSWVSNAIVICLLKCFLCLFIWHT